MDISDAPPLQWRILNEQTHVASKGGRVVAIAYTVEASDASGSTWLEFSWIPVDDPGLIDVHFGGNPHTNAEWDASWQQAHKCTEWEYARRTAS
jgi:hypothetical protein